MKRLPPAKRNQLFGVILATLALVGVVYFLLINPQKEKNVALGVNIRNEGLKAGQYQEAISQLPAITNALAAMNLQLDGAEQDVASGNLYAWTVDTMRRFKANYHVEIPTIGPPTSPGDCDLIGGFPYKQIRFSLNGTAYYHDLGKFIADFENKFPHCRVLNVSAAPAGDGPGSGERLNFQMDIVALVRPTS